MTINDSVIWVWTSTLAFRAPLRSEFRDGSYEDVYDAIQRYFYVIAAHLDGGDHENWEVAFQEFMRNIGQVAEERLQDLLLDRARFGARSYAMQSASSIEPSSASRTLVDRPGTAEPSHEHHSRT